MATIAPQAYVCFIVYSLLKPLRIPLRKDELLGDGSVLDPG